MFKHNRIYHDLQKLYTLYWRHHRHLPKAFRFTTGEQILNELTLAMKNAVMANIYGKNDDNGKAKSIGLLIDLNAILETVESLLLLAWELKILSHGALSLLTELIGNIQRQVTGWRRWFSCSE